jgi:hypothetical protein
MRRVYLPLSIHAYVHGFAAGLFTSGQRLGVHVAKDCVPFLAYSTIFQAGVDCVVSAVITKTSVPPQLASRFEVVSFDEELEIQRRVTTMFDNFNMKTGGDDDNVGQLQRLAVFVAALLIATEKGTHLLWPFSFLDPARLGGDIPAEILVPLRNVLSCMTPITPIVVTPSLEVDRDRVILLDDILSAAAYQAYVAKHGLLDTCGREIFLTTRDISRSASRLSRAHRFLLRRTKQTVSVLEAGAKHVEKLGKLSGPIAELLSKALSKLLKDRSRLVVYDLQQPLAAIAKATLHRRIQNEPDSSTRPNST